MVRKSRLSYNSLDVVMFFLLCFRNALEEEKSKSLNLSDLLESERQALWRAQAEIESLRQQQGYADPRVFEV